MEENKAAGKIVLLTLAPESAGSRWGRKSSGVWGGNMGNQEIVRKFLASKAFDFEAFGKFVAENGASSASSEGGEPRTHWGGPEAGAPHAVAAGDAGGVEARARPAHPPPLLEMSHLPDTS
jgi:hypothetical protein